MEYIWQISFPLFSFLFEMNCRLAASNVWHSFSFSLLGLNPNTNLNFTSSALFVNILAVAAKCFPKAHKTRNPKGKHCLAAVKFAFHHLSVASHVQNGRSVRAHLTLDFRPPIPKGVCRARRSRRRDVSPTHPVRVHAAVLRPRCHGVPGAVRAARNTAGSSRTVRGETSSRMSLRTCHQ